MSTLANFQTRNLQANAKIKSLLNTLLNLVRNDVTSRLKAKNLLESERQFLMEVQTNDAMQPIPASTYVVVALANTLWYLTLQGCVRLNDSTTCSYELGRVQPASGRVREDFPMNRMVFDMAVCSDCMRNPKETLARHFR